MKENRVINGREVAAVYKPLQWHVPLWRDKSKIVLATGSAGGGKSRVCAEKLHAYCDKYPRATCLMLRKTRESTNNSIVAFMRQTVMYGIGSDKVNYVPSASRFEYANGSVLIVGGMRDEKQREHVRSIGGQGGVDMIWLEEASQFSEADFNELLPRLRGKAASWRQIMLSTNPDAPAHWINKRIINGNEGAVYYSSARDNPYNPSDYLETLALLTGVQKLRLVDGLWVQAEGAVYELFDQAIHLVDAPPPPEQIKYYIAGVDWGFTNPGVLQVWAVDYDRRICLVEEVYKTRELVAGERGEDAFWLSEFKRAKAQYDIRRFICDPSEPAYIETMRRAGLNAQGADNAIRFGIDSVNGRLRVAGDGRPRITFVRGACANPDPDLVKRRVPTSSLEEISLYAWPKSVAGKNDKEVPTKTNDHGMDTMRYVSVEVDKPEGVYFR